MSVITQYPELLALTSQGDEYVKGEDSLPVPVRGGDLSPAIGRGFDFVRTIQVWDRRRWLFWRRTVMATLTLRVVNVSKQGEGALLFLSTDLRWTTSHKKADYRSYTEYTITNDAIDELQSSLRQRRKLSRDGEKEKELFNAKWEPTIPVDWAGQEDFGAPNPWSPMLYFMSTIKSVRRQYPDAACMLGTIAPIWLGQLLAWIKQQPEVAVRDA